MAIIRRIAPDRSEAAADVFNRREWLVTNGIGGYASGTISGLITRRYDGLLIAAVPVPHGRVVMLSHLSEQLRLPDGSIIRLFGEEPFAGKALYNANYLTEFRLESGLPVWRYEFEGYILEKRLLLPHEQNTVYLQYRLIHGPGRLRLKLRPSMNFRRHDAPVNTPLKRPYSIKAVETLYEVSSNDDLPPLKMRLYGDKGAFTIEEKVIEEVLYNTEEHRGYECKGDLWSPGYFRIDLEKDIPATLVASIESWETISALEPDKAFLAEQERKKRLSSTASVYVNGEFGPELVLAADQFIISPVGRTEDAARAKAAGDEVRTVIAGYHWFTDWGRDTMISLEGLTLITGRHNEAGYILRTFAHYVKDGLIPNMFPEGNNEGLYHTADATLWFFHAIDRYLEYTGDHITLERILPVLIDIISHHVRGTRFGIKMDPEDGLLIQGEKGYQLTWMDAKVGEWIITPRRGKAVEINALWYNALRLLYKWVHNSKGNQAALYYDELAGKARGSFNKKFWYGEGGYLFDVIEGEHGNDASLRPNQLFAISLPNPVLDEKMWEPVVKKTRERLLTPVGLRSLEPGHKDYKARYYGDIRARDAAYHQGTVWAWLIGPFIDAWLKVYPGDYGTARLFLGGFASHLKEACAGSISEVFDAEPPFNPGGCIAQAWSVAEVLRSIVKTSV